MLSCRKPYFWNDRIVKVGGISQHEPGASYYKLHFSFLAWAWLAKAKGHSCHTKKSNLAKIFTKKKKRVKVRSTTGHYATKKRPVKITMYLGLNTIIKLKFTINFDRCAILNVLSYLTKNFES